MKKISTSRLDMVLPTWLKEVVVKSALDKGVSVAEYVKDAIKEKITRDAHVVRE